MNTQNDSTFGTKPTESIFDSAIEKDNGMDLMKLVQQPQESKTNFTETYVTEPPKQKINISEKKEDEEPKSALELAKEAQKKKISGAIYTTEEIKEAEEVQPKISPIYNSERMGAVDKELENYDDMMKKRAAVVQIKAAGNEFEYTRMIDEISSVAFDENGEAHFTMKDGNGNPVQPVYVRLRTEEDP